jgi:hypothetical protein
MHDTKKATTSQAMKHYYINSSIFGKYYMQVQELTASFSPDFVI